MKDIEGEICFSLKPRNFSNSLHYLSSHVLFWSVTYLSCNLTNFHFYVFKQCYLLVYYTSWRNVKSFLTFGLICLCNMYLYELRNLWQLFFHVTVGAFVTLQIWLRQAQGKAPDHDVWLLPADDLPLPSGEKGEDIINCHCDEETSHNTWEALLSFSAHLPLLFYKSAWHACERECETW